MRAYAREIFLGVKEVKPNVLSPKKSNKKLYIYLIELQIWLNYSETP